MLIALYMGETLKSLMSTHTSTERSIISFNTALMIFMFLVAAFKLDFVDGSGINTTVFFKNERVVCLCIKYIVTIKILQ